MFEYQTGDSSSFFELDDAPDPSWSRPNPGVAPGSVERSLLESSTLGGERAVWIYRPASLGPGPAPLLIVTDGENHLGELSLSTTLDNLIHAGRIPPLVAVGVTSPSRGADMSCNTRFGDFLAGELLAWAADQGVVIPDPGLVAVTGYSLGGLASACAALQHPHRIGLVLSQSGSFHRAAFGGTESEGVRRWVADRDPLGVRFYLEAGIEEIGPFAGGAPSLLEANRNLASDLEQRGYDIVYVEYASGHEPVSWRETLHVGLIELFGR